MRTKQSHQQLQRVISKVATSRVLHKQNDSDQHDDGSTNESDSNSDEEQQPTTQVEVESPITATISKRRNPVNTNNKKKRRRHPGLGALMEIRKHQKSTDFLIQKLPFQRLIREISEDFKTGLRYRPEALEAIQHATETYITELMNDTCLLAIHARRITIKPQDIRLLRRLRHEIE